MLTVYFPALFLFWHILVPPPPHDCQCFGGYSADAGLSTLYLDAVFLWMLKAGVMVLFFHCALPAPCTPLSKGRAGSTGWQCYSQEEQAGKCSVVWPEEGELLPAFIRRVGVCFVSLSSSSFYFKLFTKAKQETVRGW